MNWEWFEPDNPDRLFIVKTDNLHVYELKRDFTREDLMSWLKSDEIEYDKRCVKRSGEQKHFTFTGFKDLLRFVDTNGYIPGYARVMIEKNGDMVVVHGRHRWAAAYLCGVKEIQTKLCRSI